MILLHNDSPARRNAHSLAERRLLHMAPANGPEAGPRPELEAVKQEVLNKVQLQDAPGAKRAMDERIKSAYVDVNTAKQELFQSIAAIATTEFNTLKNAGADDSTALQKVKDRFVHAGIDIRQDANGSFTASALAIEQTDVAQGLQLAQETIEALNKLPPSMKGVAQEMLQDAGDAAGKKIVDTFTALGKNPKAFALLMNLDLANADLLTSIPAEQKKTIDPILAVDPDLSVMQSVREKFGRVMAQEKPATGAFSNDQMQEMLKPVQDELNKNASKIPTMTDAQLQRFKGQLMLKYGVAIEESGEGADRTLTASAPSSQWEVFMNKFLGIMAIIGSLQAELQNKGKKETQPTTPEQQPEKPSTESKGRKLFEKIGISPNDKGEYVFKADFGSGITDVTYKFLGGEWKWQDNKEALPQTLTANSRYNYQPKDAAGLTPQQRKNRGLASNIAKALGGLKNATAETEIPQVDTNPIIESKSALPEVQKRSVGEELLGSLYSMEQNGDEWEYDAVGTTGYFFKFNSDANQWQWRYEDDGETWHETAKVPVDKWSNDATVDAKTEVPIPVSYYQGLNDRGVEQATLIIQKLQELNAWDGKEGKPEWSNQDKATLARSI